MIPRPYVAIPYKTHEIPAILAAPKLERQCGKVSKHVHMHTAVFVKNWHAYSEGGFGMQEREQEGWGGKVRGKKGEGGREGRIEKEKRKE